MKRAIILLVLLIACATGLLITKGVFSSLFVSDESMEPELPSGSLMTVKRLNPEDVKVGDVIVYNVPKTVRDYYNYPPVVSRNVIEIRTTPSLSFRTKGNKTGMDPFIIKPSDIRGTAGTRIPYLDLPLKLFQNLAGLITVISIIVLLTVLLYSRETIAVLRIRMPFLFIDIRKLYKQIKSPEPKTVEKTTPNKEPVQFQPDRAAKHLAKPFIPVLNKPALPADNQKYNKTLKEIPIIKTEIVKPSIPVLKTSTVKDNRKHGEVPGITPITQPETAKTPTPILEPVLPRVNQKHVEVPAVTPIIKKEPEKKPVPILEPVLPQANQKHEEVPAVTPITQTETEKAPAPAALNKAATSKPVRTPEKLADEAMKAEKELYEALDRLNSILNKYKNQE
jgi:signal peptidase